MKKWSQKFNKCVVCGETKRKYYAKGKCVRCYKEKYYHSERYKQMCRAWYGKWIKVPGNKAIAAMRTHKYKIAHLSTVRETDKKYQKKRRAMGLVDKTKEYNEWRRKNPCGSKAQGLVNYYINIGEIKRQPCEFCKAEPTYAHHDDYTKKLEVRWMCPSCHKLYHMGLLVDNSLTSKKQYGKKKKNVGISCRHKRR